MTDGIQGESAMPLGPRRLARPVGQNAVGDSPSRKAYVHLILLPLALLTFVLAGATEGDAAKGQMQDAINSFLHAPDSYSAARHAQDVIANTKEAGFRRLVVSGRTSVALLGMWHQTLHELRTTASSSEKKEAITRFVGFTEGRTRIVLPTWWVHSLSTGRLAESRQLYFPAKPNRVPITVYRFSKLTNGTGKIVQEGAPVSDSPYLTYDVTVYPAHARLLRYGRNWELVVGKSVTRLPGKALAPDEGYRMVTVKLGETKYLGLGSCSPIPYMLYGLDAKTDRIVWDAHVWAGGGLIQLDGLGYHYAAISDDGDQVVVAGIGAVEFYLEGFDKKTGACRFRFCSLYGIPNLP